MQHITPQVAALVRESGIAHSFDVKVTLAAGSPARET